MTRADDAVVQFSIAQLDDYGPWTATPEPSLQARLYADPVGTGAKTPTGAGSGAGDWVTAAPASTDD